jgi:uncharacterized damage-inducible protein DinB
LTTVTSNSLAETHMDQDTLLGLLRTSKQTFLSSFAGISDADSRKHPGENCWSVLDTVEHLTAAEGVMLRLITETRCKKQEDLPNRERLFLAVLTDRRRKMESPESGKPQGRFAHLEEAAAQFTSSRNQAIQFVEQCKEDLGETQVTHPHSAAGTVSTREMVIIMARHAERHALQIEEIKTTLGLHAGKTAGSQG